MTNMQKKYDFVYLLKFLGIILITNSHFKPIYSDNLKQFAFGGALGCALFFFSSGFTMAIKVETETFLVYIKHRLIRILPTFWLFLLISNEWREINNWLCWGHYWFLQAIIVFYILFYFVQKYLTAQLIELILLLLCTVLFVYFMMPHEKWMIDYALHLNRFTWLYYFAIMLLGAKVRITPILKNNNNKGLGKYLLIPLLVIVVYGLKYFLTKSPKHMNLQLLFPFLLMFTCCLLFYYFRDLSLSKISKVVIKFISGLTLEIYIVQFICISLCKAIPLPYRFVCTCLLIIIAAYGLNRLSKFLFNLMKKRRYILQNLH